MLLGGTIDITAHEVLDYGTVREIIKSNGGHSGGTNVDREYLDFIKCLLDESVTKSMEQNEHQVFYEVCRDIENSKRTVKPLPDMQFNARIPSWRNQRKFIHWKRIKIKRFVLGEIIETSPIHLLEIHYDWLPKMQRDFLPKL